MMFDDPMLTHYVLQDGKWMSVEWLPNMDITTLEFSTTEGHWISFTWDVHRDPGDHPDTCITDTRDEAIEKALWFSDDGPLTLGGNT